MARVKWEFVCHRCGQHRLYFWRPAAAPVCRHGRRWSLFGDRMQAV
jgi:hypothetical protein